MGTGFTPLIKADNLARRLGLRNLWIKNDASNPTHSFKDRAVAVACAKAREFGMDTLACASTGNLAGATAAIGAKAGMNTIVFIPADLEQGKIVGASIYGGTTLVRGNYDDVNRLCSELSDNSNWAFVNINMRPYYSEGSKTLAFEIAEQLGWRAPKNIVVPVASGSLLTKIRKGLNELIEFGFIEASGTKIHIAQPAGCSPVSKAFLQGRAYPKPVVPETLAKSLAIGNPADGLYAVEIAKYSGGGAVSVPEGEIVNGIALLAKTEGIFAETAGGVVVESLQSLVENGYIEPHEETVILITGSGFKTIDPVISYLPKPVVIEPTVKAVEELLASGIAR